MGMGDQGKEGYGEGQLTLKDFGKPILEKLPKTTSARNGLHLLEPIAKRMLKTSQAIAKVIGCSP